jgi:hypothetical protein
MPLSSNNPVTPFENRSIAVLIAYLSTDEVNQDLAVQMAAACDIRLELLSPRDPPPDGQFDAFIYDLDYWPQRQEVLAELVRVRTPHAVVLHSYNLDEDQIEVLRSKGVSVSGRLDVEVFHALRLASVPSPVVARSIMDRANRSDGFVFSGAALDQARMHSLRPTRDTRTSP